MLGPIGRVARVSLMPVLPMLVVAVAALATGAAATHLPDHRFLLIGYVTDEKGHPFAGVPVVVTRLRTGLDHPTRTESDGLYFVVVHLHDEDEGESLRITTRGIRIEIRARFDVGNKTVERGSRVDFRAGRAVENGQLFAETLRDYLAR